MFGKPAVMTCVEGFAQIYALVTPTLRAPNRQYANLSRLSGYAPASTDPRDRLVDNDSPLDARQVLAGASLLANWDIGPATLTSITAWRKWDWDPSNDRDFTGLPITTVSADVAYFDFLTAAPGSTGLIVGQPGDPRTYGLTIKARF